MLLRHCENCTMVIDKYSAYIQVGLECDSDVPSVVVGLPLHAQGDYCSLDCLVVRISDLEEDRLKRKLVDASFNEPKTMSDI